MTTATVEIYPVEERLSEPGEWVVAKHQSGQCFARLYLFPDGGQNWLDDHDHTLRNVTHWFRAPVV